MRKYRIKDEDENIYEISEMEEDDMEEAEEEPIVEEEVHEEVHEELSPEEIASLKRLAAKVEELLALVGEDEEVEESEDEEVLEDEDVEVEEEKEELVDTDEDIPMKKDSKSSVGAIEKKKVTTNDSIDSSIEIENAWIKRYGGK